jgi:hypothetical protein
MRAELLRLGAAGDLPEYGLLAIARIGRAARVKEARLAAFQDRRPVGPIARFD